MEHKFTKNFPEMEILPLTSRVNQGRLSIGGCDLHSLAEEFGTPLYIYDEETIRLICKDFIREFSHCYEDV